MELEELRMFWKIQGPPADHERCKCCGKDLRPDNAFGQHVRKTHWRWEKYCHKCGDLMVKFEEGFEAMTARRIREKAEKEAEHEALAPSIF